MKDPTFANNFLQQQNKLTQAEASVVVVSILRRGLLTSNKRSLRRARLLKRVGT